ncbi:MAG: TetR-like C-terminal domain-containing protein [Intrasporangium sp.]|uniref:TetR-like C-terminal domain-containing protein n=1 Tax=Intrasporangium sp. TaxID=1925024 RepID=UPI003F7FF8CF
MAQRLGVSHQAPYVHFGSRRRFLAAVAGTGLQEAADEAAAMVDAAGDDPVARLTALARAYLSFIRARPHVHDLAYGPSVAQSDHPVLQQAAIRYWSLLQECVGGCQPPGVDEAEVLRRAAAAWGAVYGIARLGTFQQIPDSVPADADALVIATLDVLIAGWRTQRSTGGGTSTRR